MKPLIAVLSALVLLAGLPQMAPLPAAAQAQDDDEADFLFEPARAFQDAIAHDQRVNEVQGESTLPSSAPVDTARWIGFTASGEEHPEQIRPELVEPAHPEATSYVRNSEAGLTFEVDTACSFEDPESDQPSQCPAHPPIVAALLEVTLEDGGIYRSNRMPVDFKNPTFTSATATTPTRITLHFTEPIRAYNNTFEQFQDSPTDWQVGGGNNEIPVLRVESPQDDCKNRAEWIGETGCTRVLVLGRPLGEDEEPNILYTQQVAGEGDPTREPYEDRAGLRVRFFQREAVDLRRPRIPDISEVAGTTPTVPEESACGLSNVEQVLSNDPTPNLTFDNIVTGHSYAIEVGLDSPEVVVTGAPVRETPVEATITTGLADGAHVIEVVGVDSNGNRSDQPGTDPPPGATDGDVNPVCFELDTRAPIASSAVRTESPETIRVDFVKGPLANTDPDTGAWTVDPGGSQEQAATGVEYGASQNSLLVTFSDPVGATVSQIRWRPDGETPYQDEAGNPVDEIDLSLSVPGLPLRPDFTAPAPGSGLTFVAQSDYTVSGTVAEQDDAPVRHVVVTSSAGDDPEPAEADDNGDWSTTATLVENEQTRFSARTESIYGDLAPAPPASPVRSETVVFDGTPPDVTLNDPPPVGDGGILGGGDEPKEVPADSPVQVDVSVLERHFRQMTLDVSYLDGDPAPPPQSVSTDECNCGGEESNIIAFQPPEGYVGEAELEVTVEDRAGNSSAVSTRIIFSGDLIGPIGGELFPNAATGAVITLAFGEPLSGQTFPSDWTASSGVTVDGNSRGSSRQPLSVQVNDTEDGGSTVTLNFGGPFPGGLGLGNAPTADPNARPRVTFDPGLLTTLAGPDEREVQVGQRVVDDVIAPAVPVPEDDQVGPVPIPSGEVTFTASTDRSGNPNSFAVVRVPADDLTAAGTVVAEGRAEVDADSFTFTIPVSPNTTSTYRIDVNDPPPDSNAPDDESPVTVTVIEDSIGPDVQTLIASLSDLDTIDISYGFDPADEATHIDLSYIAPAQDEEQDLADEDVDDVATGDGTITVNLPDDVDVTQGGLRIVARGMDEAGNVGQGKTTGLTNVPELESATAGALNEVVVTLSEAVATEQGGAAGFSILGGPGVVSAVPDEGTDRVRLALNGDLPSGQTLRVAYNGTGGWASPDGRPLQSGSVPLRIDLGLLPVTDPVAGPTGPDSTVLSWVDERNPPSIVEGYEISRNGEVVATVDGDARIFHDDGLTEGAYTYSIVTVATDGRRSDPAAAPTVLVGHSPVPDDAGDAATSGGTGFPTASEVLDECVFPVEPNITAAGGVVVSCDGRVAALVPPGAADGPIFAKFLRLRAPTEDGYTDLTQSYQLVGVAQAGFATVDDVNRYVELSFRDLAATLAEATPELATTLRVADDLADEQAPRVGRESLAVQFLTVGTFRTVQADGRSIRVYGPDPAVPSDRFATAAALSQTTHRRAGAAVIARADDYPDALAAAPLAAMVGGPVLLTRTTDVPRTTLLELFRLRATDVTLVGGTAAISEAAEAQLRDLGVTVTRIGGASRFDTAGLIAERVGSVDGGAFLATGQNFADALSASAPAAALGRPILLTATDALLDTTLEAAREVGVDRLHLVGGTAALSGTVEAGVTAAGLDTQRSAGRNRAETAVALATDMLADGVLDARRPLVASGDGDGTTSPDALAAGPLGGREGSFLLLTPEQVLPDEVAAFVSSLEDLRGMLMAGGPAAVSQEVRAALDAAGGSAAD